MSFARRVTELEEENAALRRTIDRLWVIIDVAKTDEPDLAGRGRGEMIDTRDLDALEASLKGQYL